MFDPVRTINQSTDFKITAMNLNFFKKLTLKYFCSKSFGTKSCFIQLSVFLNDRVFTPLTSVFMSQIFLYVEIGTCVMKHECYATVSRQRSFAQLITQSCLFLIQYYI